VSGPLASRRIVASADPDAVRDATAALTVGHDLAVHAGRRRIAGVVNGEALDRLNVVFVRYGAPVDVEAPATGERLAMTIPLGPMRVAWPAGAQTHTAGFALDGERPTLMTPDPAAGAIVIATDLAVLEDQLHVLAGTGLRRPLRFLAPGAGEPALAPAVSAETWRFALRQLEAVAGAELSVPVRRHLEDLLLSSLLLGLANTATALLRDQAAPGAPPAVDRAREYLEEHFDEPLTTYDVAREVGVSVRYLQARFRERYGASPMQVLRELRLQHARRELVAEARSRGRTVAHIAARSGFTHLGRFAGRYRERFGESPSQTIAGGRRGGA